MADVKISELAAVDEPEETDYLAGVNNKSTKRFTLKSLLELFRKTLDVLYAPIAHTHSSLSDGRHTAGLPAMGGDRTLVTTFDLKANNVSYSNENSGMMAENIQAAIDELMTAALIQAANVLYSNETSSLKAKNVQAAIDELKSEKVSYGYLNAYNIPYSNLYSKLTAENVNTAIDELKKFLDAEKFSELRVEKNLTVGSRKTGDVGENSLTSGEEQTASGANSAILGGRVNKTESDNSVISGGEKNEIRKRILKKYTVKYVQINQDIDNSDIIGGTNNLIYPSDDSDDTAIFDTADYETTQYIKNSSIIGGTNNRIRCSDIEDGDVSEKPVIVSDTCNAVIIGGRDNLVGYSNSAAIGAINCKPKKNQAAFGRYNAIVDGGEDTGIQGNAFIVGIGNNEETRKNGFRMDYGGNGYFAASVNGTGADVAEYFEWSDGNPDNEDRVGCLVMVDAGGKIRFANADDDIDKPCIFRRLGIISGNPGLIANSGSEEWRGKYLRDIYDRPITEQKVYDSQYDKEGNLIQKAYEAEEYILNPDYNSDEKYIPRSARREWDCVSRHGQLTVRDDGTCIEGGYCKPKERGEATASDSGLFVMKRLDDKHIFVLI